MKETAKSEIPRARRTFAASGAIGRGQFTATRRAVPRMGDYQTSIPPLRALSLVRPCGLADSESGLVGLLPKGDFAKR